VGMANVLNEQKKQQILALGRLGWSLRRIQQATRIRRETASAYLKAAGIAVRAPSGWGRREPKPANEVITDSAVVPGPSACEPYREAIDMGLSRGRNARAIWQDLVSEYGFGSSYQSVQRFVRKLRGTQTPEARVVIVTAAGQEAQVDYGIGPMVRDPENRKYRRTRLFVMTLGCSRKSVRLLTFRSNSRIWAELHERAFRRTTGASAAISRSLGIFCAMWLPVLGLSLVGIRPAPSRRIAPSQSSTLRPTPWLRPFLLAVLGGWPSRRMELKPT
jgi:transposase